MSTKQRLEGTFHDIKGQVRARYGELSDDDFERASGNVERLIGIIQERTGHARQEIEKFVGDLVQGARDMAGRTGETVAAYAHQAGDALREGYDQVAATARDGLGQAEQMVRRNPIESLAMTLGAGIVVGACLGLLFTRPK